MAAPLKIMVVDDEPIILESIQDYLDNYPLRTFSDPLHALKALDSDFFDIIVSDYRMPGLNGLEFLFESKRKDSYSTGILLTAYADKQVLLDFINRDLVSRVLEKPLDLPKLKEALDEAIDECGRRKEERSELEKLRFWYEGPAFSAEGPEKRIVGLNGSLSAVFKDVNRIAATDENVLITGETGTGKELMARLIHRLGKRHGKPFVSINCGALPENLVESELFGHSKGAFTGAYTDKPGKIEIAEQGTLFLDEIGELPPETQVKLLRVVQTKESERIGENKTRKTDFRLICATNRDLKSSIMTGGFREDLFYRISTIPMHLPPLRQRDQDMEPLIRYFLNKFTEELGRRSVRISPEAVNRLKCYTWPGNIRELENVIKRAIILLDKNETELRPKDFSYLFASLQEPGINPDSALAVLSREIQNGRLRFKEIERKILLKILDSFGGSITDAVKETGISKDKFYRSRY